MKLKQFQVDAFSTRVFGGNPAAVVPLTEWLDDALLQAIAEENNLSETAYFVPEEDGYHLRWFTPTREVKLCGHATLASAYVLFELLGYPNQRIRFHTLSGDLVVEKEQAKFSMDFPATVPVSCDDNSDLIEALSQGLGLRPKYVLQAEDYLAVFDSEKAVASLQPDFACLSRLDKRCVIATAPADQAMHSGIDFVSRVFAPKVGIPEDPVTGSAHCELAPYWAGVFGKNQLTAHQISKRGGIIECDLHGNRVKLKGSAVLFAEGEIFV